MIKLNRPAYQSPNLLHKSVIEHKHPYTIFFLYVYYDVMFVWLVAILMCKMTSDFRNTYTNQAHDHSKNLEFNQEIKSTKK